MLIFPLELMNLKELKYVDKPKDIGKINMIKELVHLEKNTIG